MARKTASADSPPPPISPSPMIPLSVSTSTMVRTKRPQWQPLAWRNGASSGTVTVVARISTIFMIGFMVRHPSSHHGYGEGDVLLRRRRVRDRNGVAVNPGVGRHEFLGLRPRSGTRPATLLGQPDLLRPAESAAGWRRNRKSPCSRDEA